MGLEQGPEGVRSTEEAWSKLATANSLITFIVCAALAAWVIFILVGLFVFAGD
ncbi:hypothetical protein ACFWFF_15925 [Streptomyces sp. NPDC060223]|uniref:hypothetical protein n=1 Tax=unclassified Streptomyces TaxID=2593676 RepID=UPI003641C5CD